MHKRAGSRNTRLVIPAITVIILTALILIAGCASTAPAQSTAPQTPLPEDPNPGLSWKDTVLQDQLGRGTISISGFAGRSVIVPVVSVSCSSCIVQLVRQLEEIDRLARNNPNRIVVVSLDIDPDAGPGFIRTYADSGIFSGYAVRSPQEMTLQIFNRFGPFAVDSPTIPVIIICPDGRDFLLPPGLKTAEILNETITREC
jgi:cytochrome oxidase Cu insertion factor (SCO1/SenC/PrrC family)